MQITKQKVNSHTIQNLRSTVAGLAASIAKYADNPRVQGKLTNMAFQPCLPSPKKQDLQPVHYEVKPDLLNAASRAHEIGNLAAHEHDAGKLKEYKKELLDLKRAIENVAPKSEFNRQKLL